MVILVAPHKYPKTVGSIAVRVHFDTGSLFDTHSDPGPDPPVFRYLWPTSTASCRVGQSLVVGPLSLKKAELIDCHRDHS